MYNKKHLRKTKYMTYIITRAKEIQCYNDLKQTIKIITLMMN